jgi:hypothetical protein
MNIRNLLKSSLKQTVIIIIVSLVISLILSTVIMYMDRVANDVAVARYYTNKSLFLSFLYDVIGDFSVISRFIGEFGIVLLIAQLIDRMAKRR